MSAREIPRAHTIGENSVVEACSLVILNVKPYTVVAGIPARAVKELKELEDTLNKKDKNH